jgi:hypothetical protein
MARLRAQAKRNLRTNDYRIRKWWVEKYKRPANDALFMGRSWPEWQVEMFEDMLAQRELLADRVARGEVASKDGMEVLEGLNKILGDSRVVDPLIDKWERELDAGKTPNLDDEVSDV